MDVFELVLLNMKRIRTEKGLSQVEVAARMGFKQPNYSRLELGESKPSLQTLVRLSEALECEVAEFFHRPDQLDLMEQVKCIEALGKKKRAEVVKLLDLALAGDDRIAPAKRKERMERLRKARSSAGR